MKLTRIRTSLFALVLALCTSAAFSQTAPPPAGHMHGMHDDGMLFGEHSLKFFTDLLSLTDAQQAQIKQLIANGKPAMRTLFQQGMQNHQAMMQLVTSGTFDEAKAQTIANQEAQTVAQMSVQHARIASQAYLLLTPEQKTKLAEFLANREQKMQQHMQKEQSQPAEPESN